MIQAQLDNNQYFTGRWASIGTLENSVQVSRLPDVCASELEKTSYHYENGEWFFDEERYQSLLQKQQAESLQTVKDQMTAQTKEELQKFLKEHTITSSCHKGIEKQYSVTPEKQQYLHSMIALSQNNPQYQPSWNAAGEESTYDWTTEELVQLSMEIEAFVRPLVTQQQALETAIQNACTQEELEKIAITYQ